MHALALTILFALRVNAGTIFPSLQKTSEPQGLLWILSDWTGRGSKVPRSAGASPERETQISSSLIPNAKRVKLRHGPYELPGTGTKGLTGEPGMIWNYPDINVATPCEQCVFLRQQAGLEFMDGSNANIDRGLWLNHMMTLVEGPTRWDPTCIGRFSLPHFSVRSSTSTAERLFSSGNERTLISVDAMGADTKWGYQITPQDSSKLLIDPMNMNQDKAIVFLTLTYDYVDGPLPNGWKNIKPVWLDINQCGVSEISSPASQTRFNVDSHPWKPQFDGELVFVGDHEHDGTIDVQVSNSPDQIICNSSASYGETADYVSNGASHHQGGSMKHISSMLACTRGQQTNDTKSRAFTQTQIFAKDQAWAVIANYDYDKHEGEIMSGKRGDIMGIAIMHIAVQSDLQRPVDSTAAVDSEIYATVRRTVLVIAANLVGLGSWV